MNELEFLKNLVKEAINISNEEFSVHQKGNDNDLVTDIDFKIEKHMISKIKEAYPDYTIVSEEFNTDNDISDNCFIIDPIDGTINFANGIPLWGIQVACKKNGKTIASVITLPKLNEFYYADETGAYLNDKKISVREVPLKNAIYSIEDHNRLPYLMKMRKYSKTCRVYGSTAVSYSFVASGKIHAAVFKRRNPWDYEPGMYLCKQAGAKVKSYEGFHCAAMNQELLDILEKENVE